VVEREKPFVVLPTTDTSGMLAAIVVINLFSYVLVMILIPTAAAFRRNGSGAGH
jgi:hypothetical protein